MRGILSGLIVAFVILPAPRAAAQSNADLRRSLVLLQEQVDRLQSTHNAQIGNGNLAAFIDVGLVVSDPVLGSTVSVWGWALQCGRQEPIAQVMIDGLLAENVVPAHLPRPDVEAAYGGYCAPLGGLLPNLGVAFSVDLRNYAPGPHTVQLRIRDVRGANAASNIFTVIKP